MKKQINLKNDSYIGYDSNVELKFGNLGIRTKNSGTQYTFDLIVDAMTGYNPRSVVNATTHNFTQEEIEDLEELGIVDNNGNIVSKYVDVLGPKCTISYNYKKPVPQYLMIYSKSKDEVIKAASTENIKSSSLLNRAITLLYETFPLENMCGRSVVFKGTISYEYLSSIDTTNMSNISMAIVGSDEKTIFAVTSIDKGIYNTLTQTLCTGTTATITWTITFKNVEA